jgi:signal peptidase II
MTETALTPVQRAFTRKGLFWIVFLLALIADIATKAWADTAVRPTGDAITPFIGRWISFKWAENEGAAFSILHGNPGLLAVIAAVVLTAVFVYVYKAEPRRRFFLIALAMVAAGAIGNLYDRITLGHVRDFIFFDFDLPFYGKGIGNFRIPQRWPVWNIADMEIMLGVGILLILSFKKQPKAAKVEHPPAPAVEPAQAAEPEPQEAEHAA